MKLRNNKFNHHSGFTLVELLVVIAIIGTLASISIPIGTRLINSSKASQGQSHMKGVIKAFRLFKEDHQSTTMGMSYTNPNRGWKGRHWTSDDNPNHANQGDANNGFNKFYTALSGVQETNVFTKTKKNYLKAVPDAKDMDNSQIRGGLTRHLTSNNVHGIVDPWGRGYYAYLDIFSTGKGRTAIGSLGTEHSWDWAELGGDTYFMLSRGADGVWSTEDDILSHPLR